MPKTSSILDWSIPSKDVVSSATVTQVGDYPPTDEQRAIVLAALETEDNLRVDALAGTGKTSTLTLLANQPAMKDIPTLVLAFNVSIKKEMEAKLPKNCFASTLNGLGHRTWGKHIGRRLRVSTSKNGDVLKEYIEAQPKTLQEVLWSSFGDITKLLREAKSAGYVPKQVEVPCNLWDDGEYYDNLPIEPELYEWDALNWCLIKSIEYGRAGTIDFDDQIYLPTIFHAKWPRYPLVMVDEAQDLSRLNHEMLRQIIGTSSRLIAVGDPCQAIYGFRGASNSSMEEMTNTFHLKSYPLTTCFRCPAAVVREAKWRAPSFNCPPGTKEGSVKTYKQWDVNNLTQDAVILCRNNSPIFRMAMKLLANDRFPQIVGNDIGKSLVKALKKLGNPNLTAAEVFELLEKEEAVKLMKARPHGRGTVKDFYACLRLFATKGETLRDMWNYVEYLLNSTGPVRLMTMHKSKGLEFDNVYILDRALCRTEFVDQGGQDHNLLYVAQTRAMETLTYIESELFEGIDFETEEGE